MKIGAISFMTDTSIAPGEIAGVLEAAGFESFWAGDHSHVPAPSSGVPIDSRTGLPVPSEYWHLLDPFLALTAAAAATSTINLGTGICLVNERDPIHTAKSVASLSHLSGGRVLFGIGGGWSEQELRNHGLEIADRWVSMRERVLAMRAIWSQDVAEFQGEHVNFSPLMSWPKPSPLPPILIGGNFRNIPRVVDYGDGWCPGTPDLPDAEVVRLAGELRRQAAEAGREVSMTAFHVTTVVGLDPESELRLTRRRLDVLAAAGAERAVVVLPPQRDACLRMIDHYAEELVQTR
ncbi:probable F420-dependent oxidoreductase [Jatrophihabitans sp. GAS493]|uniref:TIGR03619 family F420-dependent LLM class oxidoreductase n=1 Tax=Jatrophihabitans sp. GAS493 TaxID=1907575 RepID=UPI000BB8CD71|nr:TIGR03619 family F420-dependent LLM class oxidoreductase [Jatrophihabitans sp. GAS493]SOD71800.1 probable F420-dependent oxidoreductase [Jatrophihabitans sp. GAS493]